MEQLVLGIFQEHLAKVIIGFRKEQVNANLLNGKGEILDVSLNCAVLNEPIARLSPYIQFEKIHVSRIGFHVDWANLKKSPIIVDIGNVSAKIQEPLSLLPRNQRRRIELITEGELIQKFAEGLKPFRNGAYGLVDRIVDNLTIDIETFRLECQTLGKFKTRRIGLWTPPLLQVEFKNVKICMVDAEGNEQGNSDKVWQHNQGRRDFFMIYKRVYGECRVRLVPQYDPENCSSTESLPLEIAKMKMEIQMVVQRQIRDGAILAVQVDVTIPKIDIDIDSRSIRLLIHLATGVQYCFAKDRSFEDPLKSKAESDMVPSSFTITPVEDPEFEILPQGESIDLGDEGDKFVNSTINGRKNSVTNDFDGSHTNDGGSVSSWQSDDSNTNKLPKPRSIDQRPIILLPNGLIIHRSLSLTCSITDFFLCGSYPHDEKGGIEFVAKGCIAEAIWPKSIREQGMYAQLSTSFVSLLERFDHHKRTLLLGGMQRDDHLSLHLPSRKTQEIGADESFPLFERRGIRDDPLDLRHLFPTQAFGLKTTIDVLKQSNDNEIHDTFMILHEVGVDEIDIVLDTNVIHRVVSFFFDKDEKGFDPRWNSGDWTDILTPAMLRHPSETLQLDKYLQEQKQILLDENSLISSDLFNVTARLSNVEMRIPAAVQDSLRSCDIILKWKETTFVVSSALPRTFLTGRIGNSISGDARRDKEKGIIDFPNDPSDICYRSEQISEGGAVSTFRFQLTTRGFEMNIVPVIPFCRAGEAQKFIAISNSTMILCFEGEPPMEGSNKMKITLFVSILIHELILNIDFDILAGAICTFLYHKKNIVDIVDTFIGLFAQSLDTAGHSSLKEIPEVIETNRIKKNMKGRRILARRHISQSRKTGGLAIIFCLQQKEFKFRVWRQNVPISSPLRDGLPSSNGTDYQKYKKRFIDLLKLVECDLRDLEIGIEFDFHSNLVHRTVLKSHVQNANLKIIDLVKEIERHHLSCEQIPSAQTTGQEEDTIMQLNLVELCSFGNESMPCGLNPSGLTQQFAFRLEGQHKLNSQSWSMAADVTAPSTINLDTEAMTNLTLLIIEALLLPTWSKYPITPSDSCPFPQRTIGAMLYSVGMELMGNQNLNQLDLNALEIDKDSRDPILERALRSICKLLLPSDLHVILLRFELANILITIPFDADDEDKQIEKFSFLLNQSDIITRFYPIPGSAPSDIEQVLACKGRNWSTLINTDKEGFYQCIISRQSLISITREKDFTKLETVVHPFEISLTYSGAEVNISMNEELLIDDIRLIENLQSKLKSAASLSSERLSKIYSVARAMIYRTATDLHALKAPLSFVEDKKSNADTANERDCSGFLNIQKILLKINEEFKIYEKSVRNSLQAKDNELESMKIDLFVKERERFGALSLMASRVAGWIRMGGQHRSGQRVMKKSLLWPYWVILRKELLIIYPRPSCPKPSDIVSLVNAKIQKMGGGNCKQDVKRGFAVVESSGLTRYFVTSNAQEYEVWTKEITSAIMMFSDSSYLSDLEGVLDDGAASESKIIESGNVNNTDGGDQRSKKFGIRLTSAFQSARSIGREISESRQTASSDYIRSSELEDDSSSTFSRKVHKDSSETNNGSHSLFSQDLTLANSMTSRRAEIRKKFSGVGQVTKSRLGSALQTARQKRDEISNRRRRDDSLSDVSETFVDAQESLANSPIKDNNLSHLNQDLGEDQGSFGPQTGLQFGNKLGSAIQNARIKAIENIEKQGRLSGLRGKRSGLSQTCGDDTPEVLHGPISPSFNDSSIQYNQEPSWTCAACTFTNEIESSQSQRDIICGMCENERNFIHPSLSKSVDCTSIDRSLLQSHTEKVGEHVQEAANSLKSSIGSKDPDKQEEKNQRISRFSFRKRQEGSLDDSAFGGGEPLILKNIFVSHETALYPSAFDKEVIQLKMLRGKWTVKVSEISSTNSQVEPSDHSVDLTAANENIVLERNNQVPGTQHHIRDNAIIASQQKVEGYMQFSENSTQNEISDAKEADENRQPETRKEVPLFLVKVLCAQSTQNVPLVEKQWTLGDILKLYSQLSEELEPVLLQLDGKYSSVGKESSATSIARSSKLDLSEKMIVCGRILGGLLDYEEPLDNIEGLRHYQCECIEFFFNSLVLCPLPVDTLTLLSEALGINGLLVDVKPTNRKDDSFKRGKKSLPAIVAGKDGTENEHKKNVASKKEKNSTLSECPGAITSLLSACESELQQFAIKEIQHVEVKKNVEVSLPCQAQPILHESLLSPSLTDYVHKSFHEALMKVTIERDEAHAQLVGANVMHTHSLERERKKNERLEVDATLRQRIVRLQLQENLQHPNITNFFGKPDDKVERMRNQIFSEIDKVRKLIRNDDGDVEMIQLCSQLAGEISTKTSHALEIERLKQIRELERKTQATEKKSLVDELRRVKELLELERSKNAELYTEAVHCRALYEENLVDD